MAFSAGGPASGGRRGVPGLTVQLLLLTAAVLLAGGLLIYLALIVQFRAEYLRGQLEKAYFATATTGRAGDGRITSGDRDRLLAFAGAETIIVRAGTEIRLVIGDPPGTVDRTVRFDEPAGPWGASLARRALQVPETLEALFSGNGRRIRIVGPTQADGGTTVEVVTREEGLARTLRSHSLRILGLLIALSAVIGAILFVSLRWVVVLPILRIERHLESFARAPEDESTTMPATRRGDEIGRIERLLAVMQADLRAALRRQGREAALGRSVSQINHDLRNLLTAAVTSSEQVADSVAESGDPAARNLMQHLLKSLNRAARLSARTLDYIRYGDRGVDIQNLSLHDLVDQVGEMVEPVVSGAVRWRNRVPEGLVCQADDEQLFRALLNLADNAAAATGEGGRVEILAWPTHQGVAIEVHDDGPGLDDEARALFEASASVGPVPARGLGIAIVREIVAAHRGALRILRSSPAGTRLILTLPGLR